MRSRFTLTSMLLTIFSKAEADRYSKLDVEELPLGCHDDSYDMMIFGTEQWCFTVYSPDLLPGQGLNFEDAVAACDSKGDTLPIITSLSADMNLGYFRAVKDVIKDDAWLGIICDGNDSYMWQDGQALNYKAFEEAPAEFCSNSTRFAQSRNSQWVAYDPVTQFGYCICARRAVPTSPSPSQVLQCPVTMAEPDPSTGWCYASGFLLPGAQGTYASAATYCEIMYGGNAPSINSQEENDGLVYIEENSESISHKMSFWIGLLCGEDGHWYWGNGEHFSGYTNFKEGNGDPFSCDPLIDRGHFFNTDNQWERATDQTSVSLTLCIKRPTLVDHGDQLSTRAPTITTTSDDIGLPPWGVVAITVCAILIIAIVVVIILIVRRRFLKLKAEIVEVKHKESKANVHEVTNVSRYYDLPSKNDEWEIERIFVSLDYTSKLGEGAFGSVYLGRVLAKNIPIGKGRSIAELYELTNNNDTVAVKMLHETADSQAERDFRAEIDLMKRIGFHDRLVNILACVTVNTPILLITEYCANGDLLEFMRERRNYMLENPDVTDDSKVMNVKKQIMFAVQIAYGLEYLSSQGFVHRDIAARNIMVDQQETCKIGDFGLCRAIGKNEDNYHDQGGKLPLKWMPPEAIDNYQFSVASDVWSYGILLFEIVTLGGTPYAGWPASELLSRLKGGERMERPDDCSENVFEIMRNCWAEQPSDRPNFTKLRKRLGVLLEEVNQNDYYLKLNAQANYYMLDNNSS